MPTVLPLTQDRKQGGKHDSGNLAQANQVTEQTSQRLTKYSMYQFNLAEPGIVKLLKKKK